MWLPPCKLSCKPNTVITAAQSCLWHHLPCFFVLFFYILSTFFPDSPVHAGPSSFPVFHTSSHLIFISKAGFFIFVSCHFALKTHFAICFVFSWGGLGMIYCHRVYFLCVVKDIFKPSSLSLVSFIPLTSWIQMFWLTGGLFPFFCFILL